MATWTREDRAELEALDDVRESFGHWNLAQHVRDGCFTCIRVKQLLDQYSSQYPPSPQVDGPASKRER